MLKSCSLTISGLLSSAAPPAGPPEEPDDALLYDAVLPGSQRLGGWRGCHGEKWGVHGDFSGDLRHGDLLVIEWGLMGFHGDFCGDLLVIFW